MMLLDVQQDNSANTSPLIVTPKDENKGSLSFSDLLRNVGVKEEEQSIKKAGFVLSLDNTKKEDTKSSKSDLLTSILSGDDTTEIEAEILELNPKLSQSLSKEEMNSLITQAKQFLKDKIVQSDEFKRSEIDLLPKTLKGLTQVAKKIGIDISKITLEEVESSEEPLITDNKQKRSGLLEAAKSDASSELKEVKNLSEKASLKLSNESESQENIDDVRFKEQLKSDTKLTKESAQTVKSTPLFKAQTNTEITTEQLVNSKISNTNLESKNPKQKADETLQLLLRGEKAIKSDTSLTADFSVATAKVIAPSAKSEASRALESLLKCETATESSVESKVDGLNTPKADSFEVKLNEAKQMIKYLSQDVKSAIEDYKAPFTRVKVQLNPQKLGEVDLTIVQRGKNLHINLSSNNAAINTLAMNANDLKVQLQNSGINNASLNFSNNSQSGENANGGQAQHQQHNNQSAQDEYNYFDIQEENEEILSSLEIVVPNYA